MRPGRELLRRELAALLPVGHEQAVPAKSLARALGVNERVLRDLIAELVFEDGLLVGSSCVPGQSGLFLIRDGDHEDLRAGTEALRRHAIAILRRFHAVRRAALSRHGPEAGRLFDLVDGAA